MPRTEYHPVQGAYVDQRSAPDPFIASLRSVVERQKLVDEGIRQAIRHGHPTWSHLIAHGPCTRND